MRSSKLKWIIGGAVIVIVIMAMSLLTSGENLVYYYTPDEVVENSSKLSGQVIKVGAFVKEGSIRWDETNLALSFVATDQKTHDIAVTYKGTPPNMFRDGQGVVVEGRLEEDGTLTGTKLMIKHSEEYKKPEDHTEMDSETIEKTLIGQ